MKTIKFLNSLVLIFVLILLSACSNSTEQAKEKIDATLNLFSDSYFLSDGKTNMSLYNDEKEVIKNELVIAPPKGSVMTAYHDISGELYDGFSNRSSVYSESSFILAASKLYTINNEDKELLEKMVVVIERLKERLFVSNIENNDLPFTLISHETIYNFKNKQWEDSQQRVYIDDILMYILALSEYQNVTSDSRYEYIVKDLSSTITFLSNEINQKMGIEFQGAMYPYLTKTEKGYTPHDKYYPFEFTWLYSNLMTTNYPLFGEISRNYIEWANNHFSTEQFFNNGIPRYDALNNDNSYRPYSPYINTTTALKTLAGLSIGKVNTDAYSSLVKEGHLMNKPFGFSWIPMYVHNNGNPVFNKGDNSYFNLIYLKQFLEYNGESLASKNILNDIIKEQYQKENSKTNGTWFTGNWGSYEETFIMLYVLLNNNEIKNAFVWLK